VRGEGGTSEEQRPQYHLLCSLFSISFYPLPLANYLSAGACVALFARGVLRESSACGMWQVERDRREVDGEGVKLSASVREEKEGKKR
jgi:hypothetical protein